MRQDNAAQTDDLNFNVSNLFQKKNNIFCYPKPKKIAKHVYNFVVVVNAVFVSFIFFELSKQSCLKNNPNDKVDAIFTASSSFICNFLLTIVFGFSLANFVIDTRRNPMNLVGLLALMPAIAGFTLGVDGAAGVNNNKGFMWLSGVFLFLYSFSTRSVGIVRMLKKAQAAFIEPFEERSDREKFNTRIVLNLVEQIPRRTVEITRRDYNEKIISPESLNLIFTAMETYSPTVSTRMYSIWSSYLRKIIAGTLAVSALSTAPLWLQTAKKGWDHLDPGLVNKTVLETGLKTATAISNLPFYVESGLQLPHIFERCFVPLLLAFYNPEQNFLANGARIALLPIPYIVLTQLIVWLSGTSMSFEANGIDLTDKEVVWGLLAFLNPCYNKFVQFIAGGVVNNAAVAACSVTVIARSAVFQKAADHFLRLIRARTEASEERRALLGRINISKEDFTEFLRNSFKESKDPEVNEIPKETKENEDPEEPLINGNMQEELIKEIEANFPRNVRPRLRVLGLFGLKPTYPQAPGDPREAKAPWYKRVLGW